MSEPAEPDRGANSTETTTGQGQRDDAHAADPEFLRIRSDIGKYLLAELSHRPRKVPSGERRYLNPLWVFSDRENYESELSRALSSHSFLELVAPSVSDSLVIKEKIKTALTFLVFRERCVLIQFWAPRTTGGQCLLATSGQPFGLGVLDEGLCLYRMDSRHYKYNVDRDNDDSLGLPGRVFRKKLPEWTSNVRHYSAKDYPQRDHALHCNIKGSLALPVFEPYGQHCIGVLELVMYPEYLDCAYEVQEVCRALKDVDLTSSNCFGNPCLQVHPNFSTDIFPEGYQHKLDEIFKGLEVVCNTHSLPLAQTWVVSECSSVVASNQSLELSCSSFNQSCMGQICMSTSSLPFYLSDARMWQFRKACTEHHLPKGQGVVGLALSMYSLCLCTDLTVLKDTEYPLVYLASKYGLTSCFAICLWSKHNDKYDYIIEFFLPPTITELRDIQSLVESILVTLKPHLLSFKAASAMDMSFPKIISVSSNGRLESIPISQIIESPPVPKALANGGEKSQLDSSDLQLVVEDDAKNNNGNAVNAAQSVSFNTLIEKSSDISITFPEKKVDSDVLSSEGEDTQKIPERKRRRNEKSLSLENIRKQFGRTIEEAADVFGVSRSTLKRICRQHGIERWPSCKRAKDDSSLKPKQTEESSQVTGEAFDPTLQPANFFRSDQQNSRLIFQNVANQPAAVLNPSGLVYGEFGQQLGGRPTESMVNLKKLKNLPSLAAGGPIPKSNGTNHKLNDLPPLQLSVGSAGMIPAITSIQGIQGVKSVNIKAAYKSDIIKFQFALSAGMVVLEEQVAMRLKLKLGNFVLKYLDGDGDWISITCDSDLYYPLGNLGSSGITTIRLLVQPTTK